MPETEPGLGGAKKVLGNAPRNSKNDKLIACTGAVFGTLAALCLILGIIALALPIILTPSLGTPSTEASAQTCQTVDPSTAPQPTSGAAADAASPYLTKWNEYVSDMTSRPEGLDTGCEPMRFPSTASDYKGIVVMWHGFSSCTQEMTVIAPPIAAMGYDVLLPVMPGHGNKLAFEPDGAFYMWGYLTFGIAILVLACLCCCRGCPCCKKGDCMGKACGTSDKGRTYALSGCALVCGTLLLVSMVAIILVATAPGPEQCVSLSPLAFNCGGDAEKNDNLPTSKEGYMRGIDRINSIAALATGRRIVVGLSGGGGAALYAGQATAPGSSTALYERQLLLAPYIGLEVFESVLGPANSLGFGQISIHYGDNCANGRRQQGKAGYCNIELRHIQAMRDLGASTMANLATPAGTTIQIVGVAKDGVVLNSKMLELYDKLVAEGTTASYCLFGGDLTGFHSFLSIWNSPDSDMHWIGEVVCRVTSFVTEGTFLPQDAGMIEGAKTCTTPCSAASCGWDCTRDSIVTCGA